MWFGAPPKEWGAVGFLLAVGVGLIAIAAVDSAGHSDHIALAIAAAAGFGVGLGYTLRLWRTGRLFLRRAADIARNRRRIAVSARLGPLILLVLAIVAVAIGGMAVVVLLAAVGGFALGVFPGMLANFLRLRREVWS